MGGPFKILILISLFVTLNGYILDGELGDRQKSVDSALSFLKIGLQEFSEGIERMVMKRLEGVENIVDEKIKQMIGNATRNIEVYQSTDQKEKNSETLSTFKTEQRQNFESPTTKVDKKISDLLFSTQIKRLFRQEMISITASLFGKLEKINDVLSTTQNEQQLLHQEIKSLSTNLSETVDQKISALTSTAQTEERQLQQNIEFLAINLTRTIEEKISDVLLTTQTEQPLLCRKIEYFTTNLTGNIEKKIIDVLSTTHTEQQVLNKKIEYLLTNFSDENVDKKISDKLSSIQTEQHILKQDVFSLTASLVGKVDGIRNASMYVAEQLSSGEAINMLRNVEIISER